MMGSLSPRRGCAEKVISFVREREVKALGQNLKNTPGPSLFDDTSIVSALMGRHQPNLR